eukprot:1159822-Pelagomonas_calceolata.AAC.3
MRSVLKAVLLWRSSAKRELRLFRALRGGISRWPPDFVAKKKIIAARALLRHGERTAAAYCCAME